MCASGVLRTDLSAGLAAFVLSVVLPGSLAQARAQAQRWATTLQLIDARADALAPTPWPRGTHAT